MKPNPRNIFQPYMVNGEAVTNRLSDLINEYGQDKVEAALIFEAGQKKVLDHVTNLVLTYSFTEVLEVFECLTRFNKRGIA